MPETEATPKLPVGQRVFGEFSWPEGKIPPVLSGKPIPVKLGFVEDVKEILPGNEHEAFQSALARWTRGMPYQFAMIEPGAKRHDFDGNPVEDVSEQHRAHAKASIEMKQLYKARRQRGEMLTALDAIDRIFKDPTRENLAEAKKASADIRKMLNWKLD